MSTRTLMSVHMPAHNLVRAYQGGQRLAGQSSPLPGMTARASLACCLSRRTERLAGQSSPLPVDEDRAVLSRSHVLRRVRRRPQHRRVHEHRPRSRPDVARSRPDVLWSLPVCLHTCLHTCLCTSLYTCLHTCAFTRIYTCLYAHLQTSP